MSGATLRRGIRRYGRYAIGVAALGWLLVSLDWGQALSFILRLSPATVVGVLGVSVVGYCCLFMSWKVLFDTFTQTRIRDAMSVTFSLAFLNLSLPSRLPSTAATPLVVARDTGLEARQAMALTVVQTTLFAACYAVVTAIGILAGLGQFPHTLLPVLLLSVVGYLLVVGLGLTVGFGFRILDPALSKLRAAPWLGTIVSRFLAERMEFGTNVQSDFRRTVRDPVRMGAYALWWTGGMVFATGGRLWLLFNTAGIEVTPLVLIPVYGITAYAVTILPVSVGGIGIAEVSATAVFTSLGIPFDVAAPIVLADRVFGSYLPGILGIVPTVDPTDTPSGGD